jgi:hypothetical protein
MTVGSLVLSEAKDPLLDEIGEVTVAPAMARHIRLPETPRPEPSSPRPEQREGPQILPNPERSEGPPAPTPSFAGFDRPPYLAPFHLVGTPLSVQLVNVHLFFGSPSEPALSVAKGWRLRGGRICGTGRGTRGRGS